MGRFSQDLFEKYFGRQRSLGARKDNLSLCDFGVNDNFVRNQKAFKYITRKFRGQKIGIVVFINETLSCSKKSTKDRIR